MFEFMLGHEFEYVFFHELKYEVKLVVIFDDFVEFDDVGVMEFFEDFDFVEGDAVIPVGVFLFDELDGNDLFGVFVDGFDDRAKTAISKSLA